MEILLILELNVMINKNDLLIKVIDFDFAQKIIPGINSKFWGGTRGYLSPEVINFIPYSLEKNQVWQLGCVLYRLYFLSAAFNDNGETLQLDIKAKMVKDSSRNPNRGFKLPVMIFLEKMLSKDESIRPTLREVSNFNFAQ
jgi:serine/threonine protein kinase